MEMNRWIIGTDFSQPSRLALVRALQDSLTVREAELHAVFALDGKLPGSAPDRHAAWEEAIDEARRSFVRFIDAAQADARVGDEVPFFVHVDLGSPVEAILATAQEIGATQIYVGTHNRRGVERAVLGSVSETVVRRAHCPVLVVRPSDAVAEPIRREPQRFGSERDRMPIRTHVYRYSIDNPPSQGHSL